MAHQGAVDGWGGRKREKQERGTRGKDAGVAKSKGKGIIPKINLKNNNAEFMSFLFKR